MRDLAWSVLPQITIIYNFSVNILSVVDSEGGKLRFPPLDLETTRNAFQAMIHHQIYMQ